jgi:hypothetical protein
MDRSTGSWTAAIVGLVLIYFLSPPLVAWTMMRLGWDELGPVWSVVYAPLIQLYEHFPPYRALMDVMFKALGVV